MADFGLGSLGATLASRFLGSTQAGITNAPFGTMGGKYTFFIPLNPDLPYGLSPFFPTAPHFHFPYGLNVDPNVPL